MLLDTKIQFEAKKLQTRVDYLIAKGAKVDIVEKFPKRSTDQNSFFYAVLTQFCVEYGETIEYVKERMFKTEINPEIFIYERVNRKTGESRKALKSSADITTEEMSISINKFLKYAAEMGIYIMDAETYKENYFYVQQLKEANKEYL